MFSHLKSQFPNRHQSHTILDDSDDEEAGLKWLGDLLDPWKGSKSSCYQTHLPPNRTYLKFSRHNTKPLVSDHCTLQAHQTQPKQPKEAPQIMNNIIILDDEQQEQMFQIEMSYGSSERSILIQSNQPIQIIDDEDPEPQNKIELKHQPPLSWSMLFNHDPSQNKQEMEAGVPKQAIKQERNILIGEEENILEVAQIRQKVGNENKSTQELIFFNKEETVFNLPTVCSKERKRIPRGPKKGSKKLSIPEDLRYQFANQSCSHKNEQRLAIRKRQVNDQTKKAIDLIESQSDFREARNVLPLQSEHNQIDLQANDQASNIEGQNNLNSQEVRFLQLKSKVKKTNPKNIVNSEKPLTQRQQQMAKELESIIHIIKDRSFGDEYTTIYKWEIGSSRYWKTLPDAWQTSFDIFIKKSKKYRAKFLKYLPKEVRSKKQGVGKLEEKMNGEEIPELKKERIRECKVKSKRKQMAQLNTIFNRILMEKVVEYQKLVQQKGRAQVVSQLEDDYLSEYEPDTPYVDVMIEQMVLNANSIKNKRKTRHLQPNVTKKVHATNQLLIHNLSKAADQYNYVESMRNLYKLNKKHSLLSCLDPNSLGLRSSDLKMINKETFESEMRAISLMNQPILVNDVEAVSVHQTNHKLEGLSITNKVKLQ